MKTKEKLEDHLESIYKSIDAFYPDLTPNKIDTMHYDGSIELTRETDETFRLTIPLLTTPEEVAIQELDIELDDDELVEGMYLDEYLEQHNIDLQPFEEQVELEISINLLDKDLEFEEQANYSSSKFNLQELSSTISDDKDFFKKATDYIREEYQDVEHYFREEKIDSLLVE